MSEPTDAQVIAAAMAHCKSLDGNCECTSRCRNEGDKQFLAALAAISASENAAWMSMETAPKDGTDILVLGGAWMDDQGFEFALAAGSQHMVAWPTGRRAKKAIAFELVGGGRPTVRIVNPTRWRQLPAPHRLALPHEPTLDGSAARQREHDANKTP